METLGATSQLPSEHLVHKGDYLNCQVYTFSACVHPQSHPLCRAVAVACTGIAYVVNGSQVIAGLAT